MDAGGDCLLPPTHELELLASTAIGGDQIDGNFGERSSGAKHDRALWWLANARQDMAAPLESLAHLLLDRDRGGLAQDIGIECRRVLGQDAGIRRPRPILVPRLQHWARDLPDLLPLLERRLFSYRRDRRVTMIDHCLPHFERAHTILLLALYKQQSISTLPS